MDQYSSAYAEIADTVWDADFKNHPLKAKKTGGKR
jgi:hypothetical protein